MNQAALWERYKQSLIVCDQAGVTVDTSTRRFEFKRVEYDVETAADKVLRARLERNFAHRLFLGV